MLSFYLPVIFCLIINYFLLFFFFLFSLNNNQYVFYKVWVVFFYLLLQCVFIGFFGEDFYIIVVLSAEIPVFFSFFFFCVFKTQINVKPALLSKTPKFKFFLITIIFVFVLFAFPGIQTISNFNYYLPESLVLIPQRSDFFVFYLSFFYFSPQIILFLGLLISLITLILLFFTFKNQIANSVTAINNKNVNWVRTQDISIQNNQKRSFIFFKI